MDVHYVVQHFRRFSTGIYQNGKDQNLSLNPTKISGACGRLMCCLKYENDYYEEARAQLPDVGDEIHTPEGTGQVVGLNILDISMQVKIDGLEQPLGI